MVLQESSIMRQCSKCGAPLDEDALFCTSCGTKLEIGKRCIHCGAPIDNDSLFCTSCGGRQDSNLSMFVAQPQQSAPVHSPIQETEVVSESDEKRKQYIIIACVVLAVLLCAGGWFAYQKFYDKADDSEIVDEQVEASKSVTLYGAVDNKYPITMNLEIEGSVVKGTYYYNKQGPDKVLTLSGVLNNGEMDIYESDENGSQTGHFKGYYSNGEYQGEFITMQGKSMYFRVTE